MTTGTLTLADFLLARIAEDEDAANRAGGGAWLHRSLYRHLGSRRSVYAEDREIAEVEHTDGWHIARHDPARVLAECEATRRIVELHRPIEGEFFHGSNTGSVAAWRAVPPGGDLGAWLACATCGEFSEYGVPWPCPTLRLLALPYAEHPDYDESWKP